MHIKNDWYYDWIPPFTLRMKKNITPVIPFIKFTSWGLNTNYELGDGTNINKYVPTEAIEFNNKNIVDITTPGFFIFGLSSNNKLFSLGDNSYGQLGTSDTIKQTVLTERSSLGNIIEVACSSYHTAYLNNNNEMYTAGRNLFGQIGNGNYDTTTTFYLVSNMAIKIFTGPRNCFYIHTNGDFYGWGYNTFGQVGTGNASVINSPQTCTEINSLSLFSKVKDISSSDYNTTILLENKTAYVLGRNTNGQLGNGVTATSSYPQLVPLLVGLTGIIGICTSKDFSAFLTEDGLVYTCGAGTNGLNGNMSTSNILTPTVVSGITGVTQLSCSNTNVSVLTEDGSVYSWGTNTYGQLGLGYNSGIGILFLPQQVHGLNMEPYLNKVIKISQANNNLYAIRENIL